MDYIPSTGCNSIDNRHDTEKAEPPYYLRCKTCGKRFFLIEEDIVKEAGIKVMQRPLTEN